LAVAAERVVRVLLHPAHEYQVQVAQVIHGHIQVTLMQAVVVAVDLVLTLMLPVMLLLEPAEPAVVVVDLVLILLQV
jgi:hypothetical protein